MLMFVSQYRCSKLFTIALILLVASPVLSKRRRPVSSSCSACTHRLETSDGIWVRNPKRAYGLDSTITLFSSAVRKVRSAYPDTPAIMVGDISFKHGGRMKPHRSHRDGRDIDAGFYFRDGRPRKYFAKPRGRSLDVKRTWALFDALVSTGRVEYIFVSYRIQRALYRHAKKQGVPKRRLNRLFQWPRHWRKRAGVIRWERGHDDHFHVRFRAASAVKAPGKASKGR